MKVLIVKTSSLGDIIHALPVLDYLHQACPGILVDWVVEEAFRDVLEGNPLLTGLHVVRTRSWRKWPFAAQTLREVSNLWRKLRHSNYDLVFDIQGNLKSGVIAWATGSKQRLGFTREFLQESVNSLFTTCKIPMREQDDHACSRYLRVVSVPFHMDYPEMDITTDISTTVSDDAAAEAILRGCDNGPVFLFHSGTTWQTKFWSEEAWVNLGKRIQVVYSGSTILLSWGNESERAAAERIAGAIGSSARLLDRYPLKGIAAIIKRVDVVVGGDTGLIHLAATVGTPTVSYYRASTGNISGPRGIKHVIVQSPLSCTRCQRTSCPRDVECRDSITVDAILAGIERLQPYFKRHTDQATPPNSESTVWDI